MDKTILILIIGVMTSTLTLLLFCYFGHISTNAYLKMGDRLFESDWFNRPLNYQKSFLLIIQSAQQGNYYQGFGVVHLDLNTYCTVSSLSSGFTLFHLLLFLLL